MKEEYKPGDLIVYIGAREESYNRIYTVKALFNRHGTDQVEVVEEHSFVPLVSNIRKLTKLEKALR